MDATEKVTVIQRRPYTCVTVETADGAQYVAFSKICQPDTWSAQMGMQLALGRAMAEVLGINHKSCGGITVYEVPDSGQPTTPETAVINAEIELTEATIGLQAAEIKMINTWRKSDAATIRRLRREIDAQVARAEGYAEMAVDTAELEASGRAEGE